MKTKFLLLMPLLAATFNSCSVELGGEHEFMNVKGGKSGSGANKLIKEVIFEDANPRSFKFLYDEMQRVKQIDFQYLNGSLAKSVTTYNYDNDLITVHNSDGVSGVFTLDKNDYLTKLEDSNGNFMLFEYANGLLVQVNGKQATFLNYVWENGNLIKVAFSETESYTYTYNNIENKMNINIFNDMFWDMRWIGNSKGNNTQNLPISLTGSWTGITIMYSYTYDIDGYPREIDIYGFAKGKIVITYY